MKTGINIGQNSQQKFVNTLDLDVLQEKQKIDEIRYSIGHVSETSNLDQPMQSEHNILQQFFEEEGLLEKVEQTKQFMEKYDDLTKDVIVILQKELEEMWRNSRPKVWNIDQSNTMSWNELRKWDTLVYCNSSDCDQKISKTPASNDRKLWEKTKSLLHDYDGSIADIMFNFKKPSLGGKLDQSILRERLSRDYDFITYVQSKEPIINGKQQLANLDVSEQNTEQFSDDELELMRKESLSIYSMMLFTNLCLGENDTCPKCGADMWMYTPNSSDNHIHFHRMAKITIRTILSTIIGSNMNLSSKKFVGTIDSFSLPKQSNKIPDELIDVLLKLNALGPEINRLNNAKNKNQPLDLVKLKQLINESSTIKIQFFSNLYAGNYDKDLEVLSKYEINKYNRKLINEVKNRLSGKCEFRAGTINDYDFAKMRHSGVLSSAIQNSIRCISRTPSDGIILGNINPITLQFSDNKLSKDGRVTSLKLIDHISNELMRFKPLAFFSGNNVDLPKSEQLRWAKRTAGQLLMAASRIKDFIKLNKINPNEVNSSKKIFQHKIWTVKLSNQFEKKVAATFDDLDEANRYFNVARFDPLFCPPKPREKGLNQGGYTTEYAQKRAPLISNNSSEKNFNIKRFQPSEKAINSINKLQNTSWKINAQVAKTVYDLLQERVNDFTKLLKIRYTHSGAVIDYIHPEGEFLQFDGGQLEEWMEILNLAGEFIDNDTSTLFWHAWVFDWRGRMYPCSNLLSPQGDDVSRGLLLFGQGLPLNDKGWKWMNRAVGRAYQGCSLKGSDFTKQEEDIWIEIQALLDTKSWQKIDLVFNDTEKRELMHKVVRSIRDDPTGTYYIWGAGDVFGKKREGFQRLNLTIEYANCLDEYNSGNKAPITSIPLVADASSNIYQHSSVLIGDSDMAKSVNVIPNDLAIPSDVYQEVANKVKFLISKNKPFSKNFSGLTQKNIADLQEFCGLRNTAKLPVMTIGYGAKDRSIILQLLSHNGEDSGIIKVVYNDLDGSIINADEYYDLKDKYEMNGGVDFSELYTPTKAAHPVSKLGKLLKDTDINESLHYKIAEKVVELYREAIEEVLKGHSDVREMLEKVRKSLHMVSEDEFVTWKTEDGSKINNIVLNNSVPLPIEAWQSNITEVKEINSELGLDDEFSSVIFTSKVPTPERRKKKESSGIAPNFIHSIDANHMRLFVTKIVEQTQTENLWSVHDAFGTHPNFGDQLMSVGIETFFQSHSQQNSTSLLHKLIRSSIEKLNNVNNNRQKRKDSIAKLSADDEKLTNNKSNVTLEKVTNEDNIDRIYLIS